MSLERGTFTMYQINKDTMATSKKNQFTFTDRQMGILKDALDTRLTRVNEMLFKFKDFTKESKDQGTLFLVQRYELEIKDLAEIKELFNPKQFTEEDTDQ